MLDSQFETILTRCQQFCTTNPKGIIMIWWATATGKTSLSLRLSEHLRSEIISADSRQIYRYMDIGTDKISISERWDTPHHMIDIVDPDETYTAGQRKEQTIQHISHIHSRDHIPLVVWGTGLYMDMLYKNFAMPDVAPDQEWRDQMMEQETDSPGFLFDQLTKIDPEEAMKHHPNSLRYVLRALEIHHKTWQKKSDLAKELPVQRPILMIGLWRDKEDTNKRINKRIKQMLADGVLVQENKKLLDMWYDTSHTAMNGIWYKEVVWYIQWAYGLDRCEELMKRNTHRYAKRQRSRFRRYIMDSKARPKEHVEYMVVEL